MRGWLLDTNVVSELARPKADARVMDWLRTLPPERTFISILTVAEIGQGIEALGPADPRRQVYGRFRDRLEVDFAGRVVPVGDDVVRLWGDLSGRYRAGFGGRAPVIDALLAATALHHRLHLATRNLRDVVRLGASAFSPWDGDSTQYPLS
ncbi:MAG: type II toxin-antitoxin system VapC family toxin [Caulobacter sp.]|nr:type II toxin-antitoxin system VapC family toxin [Caulobacter sp.]